jgi:pyruvyltransferase
VSPTPLKCYYWQRPGSKNFGDELSPIIVEYVSGRRCVYSEPQKADIAAIGSIIDATLQRRPKILRSLDVLLATRSRIAIWGSGILEPSSVSKTFFHLDFLAVRGKLTASLLNQNSLPFGDPALFVGEYFQERKKSCALGIVPHYVDANTKELADLVARFPAARVIDVAQDPMEVTRQISECEMILSSSLHGLVVADAFGIPNARLKFSDLWGGDWKFNDYASGINRTNIEPINLNGTLIELTLRSQNTEHWKSLPEVRRKLRNALVI